MTRRRSPTSRRNVRLDTVERALSIPCSTVYVANIFGGIGLSAMSLPAAVIPLSMGGEFQLVLSQRLVC